MGRIAIVGLLTALLLTLAGLATPSSSREPGAPAPLATPPSVIEPTETPIATPEATDSSPTPAPPPGPPLTDLQARIQVAVDSYLPSARYAVAITDLQTGETIAVYGDRRQLSGCVVNLLALLSVMRDVEHGLYPTSRVEALVTETIWSSNAVTALELYRATGEGSVRRGLAKVEQLIQDLGLRDTRVDHPPAYPGAEGLTFVGDDGEGGVLAVSLSDTDNFVTAVDVNRVLAALYGGQILGEPLRSQFLERLARVKPGLNYLVGAMPGGKVSHKNGFFPADDGTWVDNDAGIVRVRSGAGEYAFAYTFLSEGVEVKYDDIALAQAIGRMAWEFFATRYGQ